MGESAREAALLVIRRLHDAGFEAFLVGGCVRDMLLGVTPEDYDVATSARAEQVLTLFDHTVAIGAKFGVVLVLVGESQIEVATYRAEGGYSDHRRPDWVEFTDAKHDAERRDFTVNALFFDSEENRVLDFVGGEADLHAGVIRAVGEAADRFREDALRLLRAVRFASTLGFEIEKRTWDALREGCAQIRHVSAERIRDELTKGLTRGNPDRFLDLLDTSGLLELILPEVSAMKGVEQPPCFHPEGDVFQHTRLMLSHLPPKPSPELAFAVLLHDVGKPPTASFSDRIRFNNHDKVGAEMAETICRRLAFSNEMRHRVVGMIRRHMQFINLPRMRQSTLRRFLTASTIDDEIELHRIDCMGSHGDTENYRLAVERLGHFREIVSQPGLPPPLVTGDDLIAAGLKPGPSFKRILNSVQNAQLDGKVHTREEALLLMQRLSSRYQK